ncbi:uncharacterized protein LOC144689077 isoform X1 [Cetorhinus maximus]
MLTALCAWIIRRPYLVFILFCLVLVTLFSVLPPVTPHQDHQSMLNAVETVRLHRENRWLWAQNAFLQERLTISEAKAEDLVSQLSKITHNQEEEKRDELARQSKDILDLGKRVKEIELLNGNLSKKQEYLEAEAQKWQEQSNQCEMNMATTNDHLKRAREELKACQSDRNACRHQLQYGQASTVHGHVGLVALSVMSLKLLCS